MADRTLGLLSRRRTSRLAYLFLSGRLWPAEVVVLTSEQQLSLRLELLKTLTPDSKYDQVGLHVQFKQALLVVARTTASPAVYIDMLVASPGSDVFRRYAIGAAGGGIGLFALIRLYGELRGPDAATELRERMQQLAEENAMRGPSDSR